MPTPPPPFRSVGDFIKSQRELLSLSMRQLAEMAQVSNPYLSQIERGVYKPSAQVLKGIADALDMSAETLYREAGLLDDSVERPALSVADAIRVDPRLTPEGKQALIQVYQGLIAAQPVPERPAARPEARRATSESAAPTRRAVRKTTRRSASAPTARPAAAAGPAPAPKSAAAAKPSRGTASRTTVSARPTRKAAPVRKTTSKAASATPTRKSASRKTATAKAARKSAAAAKPTRKTATRKTATRKTKPAKR